MLVMRGIGSTSIRPWVDWSHSCQARAALCHLGARYHDWHHTANVGCYGAEWLDWLCGTMDEFWASEGKRV